MATCSGDSILTGTKYGFFPVSSRYKRSLSAQFQGILSLAFGPNPPGIRMLEI